MLIQKLGLVVHPNPEKPRARNLENIKNKKAEKRNSLTA